MVDIHPMRIPGRWTEGFVLDYHTVSSVYVGDDEFGNPRFETQRTEIGELLYRFKYREDNSVVNEIVAALESFVRRQNLGITLIVPTPPSRNRSRQPVLILANALGNRLGIPVSLHAVTKSREIPEIKDVNGYEERMRLLEGLHMVDSSSVGGRRILLFDDLYRSGATLNAITDVLYAEGNVEEVYALAVTRTRSRL